MAESTTESMTKGTTKSMAEKPALATLVAEEPVRLATQADLDALEARIHRLELACANHGVK